VFVVLLIVVAIVSVPVTLRLLVDLFVPEVAANRNRRLTLSMVALVAVVGLIGFAFGRNNDRYMTCADFAVAGAAEPDNCAK
jgi:cyanate permease